MKEDEKTFLQLMQARCRPVGEESPRDIINAEGFPLNHKRAHYCLEKWARRGWYDYGVALDLGWLTDEGLKAE